MIRAIFNITETKDGFEGTTDCCLEKEDVPPLKMEEERKLLFTKGDRTILIHNFNSRLGKNSIGIVLRDVYDSYDSVPIDFLRVHDKHGKRSSIMWDRGHNCSGFASIRNGRYYGYWIDPCYLKKESGISDEDILLLI